MHAHIGHMHTPTNAYIRPCMSSICVFMYLLFYVSPLWYVKYCTPAFACLCCVCVAACVCLLCGSSPSFAVSHLGQTEGRVFLVAMLNPNIQKHWNTCCVLAEQESKKKKKRGSASKHVSLHYCFSLTSYSTLSTADSFFKQTDKQTNCAYWKWDTGLLAYICSFVCCNKYEV